MKKLIKKIIRQFGLDIIRIDNKYGINPYQDMAKIIKDNRPMIFDVGANIGQTVRILREYFPKGEINSFEPNPNAFEILKQNVTKMALALHAGASHDHTCPGRTAADHGQNVGERCPS